jgi:hypothetical protein
MKPNVGGVRLKLGAVLDWQLPVSVPRDGQESGHAGAAGLANTIAAKTGKVILGGEMLDPALASEVAQIWKDLKAG